MQTGEFTKAFSSDLCCVGFLLLSLSSFTLKNERMVSLYRWVQRRKCYWISVDGRTNTPSDQRIDRPSGSHDIKLCELNLLYPLSTKESKSRQLQTKWWKMQLPLFQCCLSFFPQRLILSPLFSLGKFGFPQHVFRPFSWCAGASIDLEASYWRCFYSSAFLATIVHSHQCITQFTWIKRRGRNEN